MNGESAPTISVSRPGTCASAATALPADREPPVHIRVVTQRTLRCFREHPKARHPKLRVHLPWQWTIEGGVVPEDLLGARQYHRIFRQPESPGGIRNDRSTHRARNRGNVHRL